MTTITGTTHSYSLYSLHISTSYILFHISCGLDPVVDVVCVLSVPSVTFTMDQICDLYHHLMEVSYKRCHQSSREGTEKGALVDNLWTWQIGRGKFIQTYR
jgi:hypothetical protein